MPGHRYGRVAEDIKREIAAIVREMKDPRVRAGMITVVRAEVSGDLSFVKVYISAMEGLEKAKLAVQGLTGATGFIRREVGQRLKLRKTPELRFIADDSISYGMDIIKKLEDLD